ncbi:MAG: bacillithiol biosynthesis deacetylase BshB1 [Vicinamibacterales bacterium]
MSVDLLVVGPHPDDIELGLGGTIARHVAEGYSVGLCDLTAGELGSNGTPAERLEEAQEAARILGVSWRVNLRWPDGGITSDVIPSAVDLLRSHQPKAIAIPYWDDRHPDHVAASQVLQLATFRSGLRRYLTDLGGAAWRPDWICYYFINNSADPSFVVDVSRFYQIKRDAIACHRTQFAPGSADAVPTRLTASSFSRLIESRDAQFGASIGVEFAEGIIVREPISRSTLLRTVS